MVTYLVHLKGYFKNYVQLNATNYDRHKAVDYLVEKCGKEYIEPNRNHLVRFALLTLIGIWGRSKRTLHVDERQLEFEGMELGDRRTVRVPATFQLGNKNVEWGKIKGKDWPEYLRRLDANQLWAAEQRQDMHVLYERILLPIFKEFPDIDNNEALRIAEERGLLRERRRDGGLDEALGEV